MARFFHVAASWRASGVMSSGTLASCFPANLQQVSRHPPALPTIWAFPRESPQLPDAGDRPVCPQRKPHAPKIASSNYAYLVASWWTWGATFPAWLKESRSKKGVLRSARLSKGLTSRQVVAERFER